MFYIILNLIVDYSILLSATMLVYILLVFIIHQLLLSEDDLVYIQVLYLSSFEKLLETVDTVVFF